jgi:hypothetical protein
MQQHLVISGLAAIATIMIALLVSRPAANGAAAAPAGPLRVIGVALACAAAAAMVAIGLVVLRHAPYTAAENVYGKLHPVGTLGETGMVNWAKRQLFGLANATFADDVVAIFAGIIIGVLATPWLRLNSAREMSDKQNERFRLLTIVLAAVIGFTFVAPFVPGVIDSLTGSAEKLDIDVFGLKISAQRSIPATPSVSAGAQGPGGGQTGLSDPRLVNRALDELGRLSDPDRALWRESDGERTQRLRCVADRTTVEHDRWQSAAQPSNPGMKAIRELPDAERRARLRAAFRMHFPPGTDMLKTHTIGRDYIYALWLHGITQPSPQRSPRTDVADWALDKEETFWGLSEHTSQIYCFMRELNAVFGCLEHYASDISDNRIALIDLQSFIRSVVILENEIARHYDPRHAAAVGPIEHESFQVERLVPRLRVIEETGAQLNRQIAAIMQFAPYARNTAHECRQRPNLVRREIITYADADGSHERYVPRFILDGRLPYLSMAVANLFYMIGSYESAATVLMRWHEAHLRRAGAAESTRLEAFRPMPAHQADWMRVRAATEVIRFVKLGIESVDQGRQFRMFYRQETDFMQSALRLSEVVEEKCRQIRPPGESQPVDDIVERNARFMFLTHRFEFIRRQLPTQENLAALDDELRQFERHRPECFENLPVMQIGLQGLGWSGSFWLLGAEGRIIRQRRALGRSTAPLKPDPETTALLHLARETLRRQLFVDDNRARAEPAEERLFGQSLWEPALFRANALACQHGACQ